MKAPELKPYVLNRGGPPDIFWLGVIAFLVVVVFSALCSSCGGSYVGPRNPTAPAPAPADTCKEARR